METLISLSSLISLSFYPSHLSLRLSHPSLFLSHLSLLLSHLSLLLSHLSLFLSHCLCLCLRISILPSSLSPSQIFEFHLFRRTSGRLLLSSNRIHRPRCNHPDGDRQQCNEHILLHIRQSATRRGHSRGQRSFQ